MGDGVRISGLFLLLFASCSPTLYEDGCFGTLPLAPPKRGSGAGSTPPRDVADAAGRGRPRASAAYAAIADRSESMLRSHAAIRFQLGVLGDANRPPRRCRAFHDNAPPRSVYESTGGADIFPTDEALLARSDGVAWRRENRTVDPGAPLLREERLSRMKAEAA